MLAVSGELNSRMDGPGVLAPIEKEVEDLIFTEAEAVDLWPEDRNPAEHLRRSLYLFRKRNVRYPLFDAFDAPDTQSACPRRATSTHALQALALLNSEFAAARARALAGRVLREGGSGGDGRIEPRLQARAGAEPTQEEVVSRAAVSESSNRARPQRETQRSRLRRVNVRASILPKRRRGSISRWRFSTATSSCTCREGTRRMTVATQVKADTLQDLMENLGNIPLFRVRMDPAPGLATEGDLLDANQKQSKLCELVDGVLVEKAMGYRESLLALLIGRIVLDFVEPRNLGLVSGPDGSVRLFPGLVRIPDVAFAAWDRFPDRRIPKAPIPTLAPDLVVEILSESNTKGEMVRKRGEYFSSGVRLIWEIDPEARAVTVYTPDGLATVLDCSKTLDGADVLPGFSLKLSEFFSKLDQQG